MRPGAATFAEAVGTLGIGDGDRIVGYAGKYPRRRKAVPAPFQPGCIARTLRKRV
jgi:hypothetical protein